MVDNKTASLTVLGGPLAGAQCELPESGTLTIGSSPDSSLYLDLLAVSPYHARVVVEAGRVRVHDTGSSRTVHVNDNAIGPEGTELRNGDILWLGAPGDDEVVMLQCILPKRVAAPTLTPPGVLSSGATPTPEIETVALWAGEPPADAVSPGAVEDAVAEAAAALGEPLAMTFEDEAVVVSEVADPQPAAFPEETPAEVEATAEADTYIVEDVAARPAEAYVDGDTDDLAAVAPTLLMSSADEVAEAVEPSEYTPEMFEPPPAALVTEESPAEEPLVVEATPEVELPPPAPQPPPPTPPAAKPAAASPPAPSEPRDAAMARPAAWQATRPQSPSASQRQKARPVPAHPPEPEPGAEGAAEPQEAAGSRRPMLLAVGGFVAVVALAGGGFLAWRSFGGRSTAAAPTPTPVAVASQPTPAPVVATPEPEPLAPTPFAVSPAATPAPVDARPTPAATPTPRPTPTPRATPSGAAAAPTPPPSSAGPSPEELRAQQAAAQVQALVGQAETALAARQYDAALSHLDSALRLDPGNARAASLRPDVAQRRDLARRRFVAGRTAVDSEKTRKEKEKGGLVGFDADTKAPDFLGRIEFEMSPASGIEANVAWTLRVFVLNQGAKPIRVAGLAVSTNVNGTAGGGPVTPATREIAPQQRALVGESTGSWREGTTAWVAEATLTAPKNETLKSTLTWK